METMSLWVMTHKTIDGASAVWYHTSAGCINVHLQCLCSHGYTGTAVCMSCTVRSTVLNNHSAMPEDISTESLWVYRPMDDLTESLDPWILR